MPERSPQPSDELELPAPPGETPLHGYRGNAAEPTGLPAALTITISREAGRGTTIAQQAGAKLGWQVYPQDLLEDVMQDAGARQELLDSVPAGAAAWADAQLNGLLQAEAISSNPSIIELCVLLYIGVRGEAILVGRGGGCILPPGSTLNVRLVAPREDRIAYMTQWLRLTEDEAAVHVRRLDQRRADFVSTHFHRNPTEVCQYDLILNTSLLGEERLAELIVHAAQSKLAALGASTD